MRSEWARLGVAVALLAWGAACGDSEEPRRSVRQGWEVDASGAVELTVPAAGRVRIEAAAVKWAAAPRLHLWDGEANTEVAFAESSWFGGSSALEYRNPHSEPRTYTLLVEAKERGGIDLMRDGRPWLRGVGVGRRLSVPSGVGYAVQLASVPGGAREFVMFGLDCAGRLRAVEREGGPTGLPRIARDDLCSVVVQAPRTAAGTRVSVYVNDREDRDGDGLGRLLETALRTRDSVRDTDRDGVTDAAEVLGAGALLDFPRYGASPLHKDVFVEIDHDRRLSNVGLSESDLAEIAGLYATGDARDLNNPDRKPGVALHFDAGFEPADPARVGLFGDWGGSGRASSPNYRAARGSDFSEERGGTFRYAFMTKTGRGQARGDAFTVNRDLQRVSIFAHELGHTLGLEHHGHDDWGRSNCKPHYFSLMNYVYQNRPGVGFSRSGGVVLDPAAVSERLPERAGLPPAEVLRDVPLELDVIDGGVDWNRDGLISDEPVRAGLSWATYKSCGSAGFARTTLADAQLTAASPALARLGERLYALFVTEGGALQVRHSALSGPDASGSCPEGDGEGTTCSAWSMQSLVHGIEPVKEFGVASWGPGELVLAYVRPDGRLRVAVLVAKGEVLEVQSDREVGGAWSDRAPVVARVRVAGWRHGSSELLRVLYRGPDAALMQASALAPEGPFRLSAVYDARQEPITVGLAPTVVALGTGELCGVLPDLEGYVRFYCYQAERDAWVDLTSTAFFAGYGPKTAGAVGLAFHRARLANGRLAVEDATRGSLVMSFTEPESTYAKNPDNPHYFVSEWISAAQPARTHLYFRWRGSVIDEWTNLAEGTGVALFEDQALSAMKAVMLAKVGEALKLDFLPFADGVHEERLGAGNDFRVMERGVCEGIRSVDECGE